MNFILLLNGHPGAGKSTVAKELRLYIPRMAVIDVDLFRKFVSDYNNSVKDFSLMWEVVLAVVKVYLDNDISILVDRCVDQEKNRAALKKMARDYKVLFREVILYTKTLDCAVERVKNRPIKKNTKYKTTKISKELIVSLRDMMLEYKQKKNIVAVDTENNSIEQVAKQVVGVLNSK
jgi:predicted kinase